MPAQHVVVDGSNIATEGRSTPSLAQLESAVVELKKDLPETEVTVVVDATFAHRIDPSELEEFEAAALRGAYVAPPAGAIGRGDAFLLRIAEKVNATVLSNDSFQEFHGEHPWLFEQGRLLGASPVPGVGWIFVPRTPVRGPRSRVATREATRAKSQVERAIKDATAEVVEPSAAPRPSRRRRSGAETPVPAEPLEAAAPRPQAVNEPIAFIRFIAEHPLGAVVEGLVDSFTSHGAVILVGPLRCYVPLSGLAQPPPRSAREVLRKGDHRDFVITALDPFRRGVELALPEVGVVRGVPSEETVAAELAMTTGRRRRPAAATAEAPIAAEPIAAEPVAVEPVAPSGAPRRRRTSRPIEEQPVAATKDAPTPAKRPAKQRAAKTTAAAKSPATPSTGQPRRRSTAATPTTEPRKAAAAKRTQPARPAKAPSRVAAPKLAAVAKSTPAPVAKKAAAKKTAAKKAPVTASRVGTKTTKAAPAATGGPRRSPAKKAAAEAPARTRGRGQG